MSSFPPKPSLLPYQTGKTVEIFSQSPLLHFSIIRPVSPPKLAIPTPFQQLLAFTTLFHHLTGLPARTRHSNCYQPILLLTIIRPVHLYCSVIAIFFPKYGNPKVSKLSLNSDSSQCPPLPQEVRSSRDNLFSYQPLCGSRLFLKSIFFSLPQPPRSKI